DGRLYMVGFLAADKPKPIFALGVSGQIKPLSDPIGLRAEGRLASLHRLEHRLALALEREGRRAEARRRLQGPRGLLRSAGLRRRDDRGRARPAAEPAALHRAEQVAAAATRVI